MKPCRWLPALACSFALAAAAQADDGAKPYPAKAVRLIVPATAGGPTDIVARLVAERLTQSLGQPVIVENRPGASQTLGTAMVAKAEPDGYTLLLGNSSALVQLPFTTRSPLPYEVRRDFAVVSHIGSTPLVLYAKSDLPATSLKQLIALGKSKPGTLSYGSWGNGTSGHLLGEYVGKQAGMTLVHVPYKGIAPVVTDLVGGQIDLGIAEIGVPAPFVKAGKIRALAVTGKVRSPALPDVPTFAEQGIAGMEPFSPWWALLAPAATPRPIVDRLAAEMVKMAKTPEFAGRLFALGIQTSGLSSGPSTELMGGDMARWQKIIADLPDVKLE